MFKIHTDDLQPLGKTVRNISGFDPVGYVARPGEFHGQSGSADYGPAAVAPAAARLLCEPHRWPPTRPPSRDSGS